MKGLLCRRDTQFKLRARLEGFKSEFSEVYTGLQYCEIVEQTSSCAVNLEFISTSPDPGWQ